MKNAVLSFLFLFLATTFALSQPVKKNGVIEGSVELLSWVVVNPPAKKSTGVVYIKQEDHDKSRLDLLSLSRGCRQALCMIYGSRIGNNWDIFTIGGGPVPRTRMVQIGKLKWTDKFVVPYIEPWAVMSPGEKRTVTFDTSGGDGADGSSGSDGRSGGGGVAKMNGDGSFSTMGSIKRESYANAGLTKQVGSHVTTKDGKTRKDNYSPVVEAKLGYVYAVRVMDDARDFYLLIRVDELKRGERLVLSYKKLDLPDSAL